MLASTSLTTSTISTCERENFGNFPKPSYSHYGDGWIRKRSNGTERFVGWSWIIGSTRK